MPKQEQRTRVGENQPLSRGLRRVDRAASRRPSLVRSLTGVGRSAGSGSVTSSPPVRLAGAMVVLILGTGLSLAGGAGAEPGGRDPDQEPPSAPANVRVTEATPTSVSLAWDESTDNVGVAGYFVEVDGGRRAKRVPTPAYMVDGLQCGQMVTVLIQAFDRARNRSEQVSATVSAAACPDTQPPSTPTGLTVTARTATTITLAWSPATDNVGVQGYDVSVDGVARPTTNQPATTLSDLVCGRTHMR